MELFNFLTETAVSSLELPASNLYITSGDIVQHVGPGNDMTEKCDHEEADTRIVAACDACIKERCYKCFGAHSGLRCSRPSH